MIDRDVRVSNLAKGRKMRLEKISLDKAEKTEKETEEGNE